MFQPIEPSAYSGTDYQLLMNQASSLWEDDLPLWSNLANMAALLKNGLAHTNWAGFYLWRPQTSDLVVGPFQGLPACTRIPLGHGVCGTAISSGQTQLVSDVHQFPGHIACDAASQSEIVVPIRDGSTTSGFLGVIDIDSPLIGRFTTRDQDGLEALARFITDHWRPGHWS